MVRAFEGLLPVDCGIAAVSATSDIPTYHDAFREHVNGICGAAVPGTLHLVTGLRTGEVGFTVDVFDALDAPPPPDEQWEDVVEVSFTAASPDVALRSWDDDHPLPFEPGHLLPLSPGSYRVRYSARGMDEGHQADINPVQGVPVDFYSLCFWPAAPAAEQIVRQTSRCAAYWHDTAKALPR